ncbi:hypothetical protein E2542_SST23005 [Spatholobus suberectus]|nr:hypothetical protein E2542_SST23005 [Spatholobus suberectus]
MEGSSSLHEEERTGTFFVYHPCYFLEEALRALLGCLGVESESSQAKEEKSALPQTPGADPITNSPSNPDAADPPSATDQTINASSVARRGGRGSGLSDGSGPQHN